MNISCKKKIGLYLYYNLIKINSIRNLNYVLDLIIHFVAIAAVVAIKMPLTMKLYCIYIFFIPVINGEKATFNTPTFAKKRERTLDMLIKDLYSDYMSDSSKVVSF